MSTFNMKSILEMSRESSFNRNANYRSAYDYGNPGLNFADQSDGRTRYVSNYDEPLDLSAKKVNSFPSQITDRDLYSFSSYTVQSPTVSPGSTGSSQLSRNREVIRDPEYWEKRQKNNLSAKKSREKKKQQEFQQRQEVLQLEKENEHLRKQLNACMCPQTRQVYNALWLATNMSAGIVGFGH